MGLYSIVPYILVNCKSCTILMYLEPVTIQCHSPSDIVKQETITLPQEPALKEEDMDYIKQPVFLNTPLCKYTPYQMHCRRIYPGIMLVILTEVGITIFALNIVTP